MRAAAEATRDRDPGFLANGMAGSATTTTWGGPRPRIMEVGWKRVGQEHREDRNRATDVREICLTGTIAILLVGRLPVQ